MARLALSTGSRNIAKRIKGDAALALGKHEEAEAEGGSQQQRQVERTETAAPDRHGERISRERQSKQQRAHVVEAGPIGFGSAAINGQVAMREKKEPGYPAAR
jgi:hypothetical protein